jgi:hypothetical protein
MKMKPKNAAGDSDEYNKLSDVMDMQYSCGDFYFMLSMAVYGLNSCGLK